MTVSARRREFARITFIGLLGSGCASILGVEEATCSPKFSRACNGDQAEGGAQTPEPPTKEQACEEYCADVTRACGDFPQYLNESGCLVVCNGMLEQSDSDGGLIEDTLECRAAVAKSGIAFDDDPQGACAAAGPMGTGCGDECENYCDYMQRFCPEEFEDVGEECVRDCRKIPRKEAYVHTTVYDNTLECRILHIQLSIQESPRRLLHCTHAAGKTVCVD